jgi:hypothetical protein
VSTILNGRDDASAGALQGGLASLPFLPLVFIVLVLCRRVGRARFGSVIDGADRRAPWLVLCCATALGSAPAVMGQSRGRWASVDVTLALAVLAALAALFFLVRDALAFRETTRATRLAAGVRPASFEQREDEEIPVIDLGIGEEEVRCTSTPTSAYRGGGDLHAVVLGDPWTASLALRHAVTRSALGFVLCLAGIGGMVAAVGERGYDVLPF